MRSPILFWSRTTTEISCWRTRRRRLSSALGSPCSGASRSLTSRRSAVLCWALFRQAREALGAISEYGVLLGTPNSGVKTVNIQFAPVVEQPGTVVIQIEERTMASKMDRSLTHRGAARAVSGMAAVLAHEVKNPFPAYGGPHNCWSPAWMTMIAN